MLPSFGLLKPHYLPWLNRAGRCEHCHRHSRSWLRGVRRLLRRCVNTHVHSTCIQYTYMIIYGTVLIIYIYTVHIIFYMYIYMIIYLYITYMDMSWCYGYVREHVCSVCVCAPSRAWRVFLLCKKLVNTCVKTAFLPDTPAIW